MKKNIPILIITILVIILIISSFVVYASTNNEKPTIEDKVSDEIKYLNNCIISLLGHFNGLTAENEIFETSQTRVKQEKQQTNTQNEENAEEKQINWDLIQLRIEEIYQTWNTISIDLHGLNIAGNDILAFGDGLNAATQSIKKKDKAKAMEELTTIHSLLPKYQSSYLPNDEKTEIFHIEAQVVNSYVLVSNDEWKQAGELLTQTEKRFASFLNSVSITGEKHQNQTILNQCYILVNEMRNAINLKDKDIFYIQYHNFITKMGVII